MREYLVNEEKIDASMITAKGYGESRPIASNDTPEGREKNRRVETGDCEAVIGGESGIRTHGTLLTYTRFPSVRLKPLGHLSNTGLRQKD